MRLNIYSTISLATLASARYDLRAMDACAPGYTLCSPPGATTIVTPQIGDSAFANLFVDIVESSLPASIRSLDEREAASLCCIATLDCLTMATLSLPFCYDKFTTNYFLPDGSFGTVVGGAYTSPTKDTANLETGSFTLANGTTGNIYTGPNSAAKPDLTALPLPSQFTATGVGIAIPASALGDEITLTFTTTLPATTIPGTTLTSPITIISASSILLTTIETSLLSILSVESVSEASGTDTITTFNSEETLVMTMTEVAGISPLISTVESMVTVAPVTVQETVMPARVSVITTVINTAENPALFGTDGFTATGSTPVGTAATTRKSGSSLLRVGRLLMVICGLVGLVGVV